MCHFIPRLIGTLIHHSIGEKKNFSTSCTRFVLQNLTFSTNTKKNKIKPIISENANYTQKKKITQSTK